MCYVYVLFGNISWVQSSWLANTNDITYVDFAEFRYIWYSLCGNILKYLKAANPN